MSRIGSGEVTTNVDLNDEGAIKARLKKIAIELSGWGLGAFKTQCLKREQTVLRQAQSKLKSPPATAARRAA